MASIQRTKEKLQEKKLFSPNGKSLNLNHSGKFIATEISGVFLFFKLCSLPPLHVCWLIKLIFTRTHWRTARPEKVPIKKTLVHGNLHKNYRYRKKKSPLATIDRHLRDGYFFKDTHYTRTHKTEHTLHCAGPFRRRIAGYLFLPSASGTRRGRSVLLRIVLSVRENMKKCESPLSSPRYLTNYVANNDPHGGKQQ